MNPEISIIIPTLNEADSIAATLDALLLGFDEDAEIIVVDGGSDDVTLEIVENYGVKILHSARGRGRQLQAGAGAASGEIFWFVYADTIAPPDAVFQVKRALQTPRVAGGNFTIRFDSERLAAKFLSWLYPKLNFLGLIYGDSAIFVRRARYERIGGFKPFPIFEDLDFVERLRKTDKIVTLSSVVTNSSRLFENKSFFSHLFSAGQFCRFSTGSASNPKRCSKFISRPVNLKIRVHTEKRRNVGSAFVTSAARFFEPLRFQEFRRAVAVNRRARQRHTKPEPVSN